MNKIVKFLGYSDSKFKLFMEILKETGNFNEYYIEANFGLRFISTQSELGKWEFEIVDEKKYVAFLLKYE